MPQLRIIASADPGALLAHAAAPFLREGRPGALPLLAVRHAALREEILDRAALAGCVGWLGEPLTLFRELPSRIADAHAPLATRERHALISRLIRDNRLTALNQALSSARSPAPLDAIIGDLHAERVGPERAESALAALGGDRWDRARNGEVVRLYHAYLDAVPGLPPLNGLPRSDGRDGLALAAELIARDPGAAASRLRQPFSPDGALDIRLLGLMDLRRGWRLLLDALRGAPFVSSLTLYLPARPEPADVWSWLEEGARVEALPAADDGIAALAAALFADQPVTVHAPMVGGLAAPDADREVEAVARRVKKLIVEDGVHPRQVTVAARHATPYVPLMADRLRRLGVPVSARIRSRLMRVPAVGAFLGLFRPAAEGCSLRALLNLAESPYFSLELDVRVLTWIHGKGRPQSLESWEQAIERLAAGRDEDPDGDRNAPRPERAARALERFGPFRERMDAMAAARPLSEWIALATSILAEDGLWDFRRRAVKLPGALEDPLAVDAVRLDLAGIRTLDGVLLSWKRALAIDPDQDAPLDAAGWLAELADALERLEIELATPGQSGVRVTEATAAVGVPREHLFLVGMSSGAFPAEPPPRTLFSRGERFRLARAGLPLETEDDWFDREAALFRALVSTARGSVVASHAYAGSEGQVQLPSAYFEEVRERLGAEEEGWCERIPGSRLVPDSEAEVWSAAELWRFGSRAWARGGEGSRAALAHLARGEPARVQHVLEMAALERGRTRTAGSRLDRAHAHNGRIAAPELIEELVRRYDGGVWSVSRLESFGLCPWRFFGASVLRLESLSEPEDDVDAMTRGSLLHDCLEEIHRRMMDGETEGALDPDRLPEVQAMLDGVVHEVVRRHAERGWLGTAELRLPRIHELRRTLLSYVRWEAEQNLSTHHSTPPRRRPIACEMVFGMDDRPPVELTHQGRTLRLRGRIDRVDEIVAGPARGWRYVVDHKSSTTSLSRGRYDAGVLLQLPIYMKVVEAESGAPVWGGSYQGMGTPPARGAPLHPHKDALPGTTATAQAAMARLNGALEHALRHVDGILSGGFPAALPDPVVDPESGEAEVMVKACPQYCDFKDVCRHYVAGEEGGA